MTDLISRPGLAESARLELARRLGTLLGDRSYFESAHRAAYVSDASNYRHVPLGVVYPRSEDEVAAILATCAELDAPVTGRGTGTSLSGQACNETLIVDMSRHLNKIVEIDAEARRARVQPGLVCDHLQAALRPLGLAFGPDPATHAYCTVGGMVGNNSCGTHALWAGKTVDNVERLVVYTYGGTRMEVGPTDEATFAEITARGDEQARIYLALRELIGTHADQVRAQYPKIPRRVSGYNLDELLPETDFNVARALVGTESTCALTTEITVRLVDSPPVRRLVVMGFEDVFAAADYVPVLLEHELLALEGFDDLLITQMRRASLNLQHLHLLPPGRGWLIAEVGGGDADEADARAEAVLGSLAGGIEAIAYGRPEDQRGVWAVRESGLGATAHPPGDPPNHEGWEDGAVAPEHLGTYLRGVAALWERYGYHGAWYGHFGQGCVHTRNDFDFATPEGLATFRAFMEDAADLCVSLGGSLSGEHGDGQARSELLGKMFSPELIGAFESFKSIFDPRGRMNPGMVVHPLPMDEDLTLGPAHTTTSLGPLYFSYPDDHGSLQEAVERCVGIGRCRRDDTAVMCPSYRATRDELQTTRGRARLFAEMFRGEVTEETWQNEDVREALELCLSCKGCAVDCPTHVDMATYKAEFLAHYYEGKRHPIADYALGLLPKALQRASVTPRLANALVGEHAVGRALRRAAGITTDRPAPRLAPRSFRRLERRRASPGADVATATVVLFPDTFSDLYKPSRAGATRAVLEAAGEVVTVPERTACCGRPLFDVGMLDRAREGLTEVLDTLEPFIEAGLPIIVPEPSCLASFRDELPRLLADDPRAALLAELSVSLAEHLATLGFVPPRLATDTVAYLHPHCHQRAITGDQSERAVLEAAGYRVEVLDLGCCGLAGGFGFRTENAEISTSIANERFVPAISALSPDAVLILDGFSCATQAAHLAGRGGTSLAELLAAEHLA
jgi:FAD/FMN-containing dehydrogenase/Fe-S oxidoreductase